MLRVMSRVGPSELTLAAIAKEADLTAGALVQRFGSKHELQVALAKAAAGSAGALVDGLAAQHDSPLAAVRDYAACMAHLAASPEAVARNLAYLANDISDPALRKHLLVQSSATRTGLKRLLDKAVKRRELRPRTDSATLARTLEAVIGGALITAAVYREMKPQRCLQEHVEAVLAPYVTR